MIKKIICPILIGAGLAVILLMLFPTLRSAKPASVFSDSFFHQEPLSYRQAVKNAAPAVVNIYSRTLTDSAQQNSTITPLGSGVIMSKDGYIITNYHVINGAEQILVARQSGQIYDAILIGSDELVDLAVLKIDADDNLPVIPINPKLVPHIGDVVLAIGNPFNIGQTITQGIISATGRDGLSPYRRQNFIQTDASINHGNSGGALVNTLGELVGINTLSFSKSASGDSPEGLGFAIPTALATKVMRKLIEDGQIIRGYIGVDGLEFAPSHNPNQKARVIGILVTNADGPAAEAGIQPKDIITQVDGKAVTSIIETMDQIAEIKPGTTIPVEVLRDGHKILLQVTVARHPN